MKISIRLFLLTIFPFVIASCQNHSAKQESSLTGTDTLFISDLETVISTESALLGEPREIVSMDEHEFAVYDHGYKKIIMFNQNGDKLAEFGEIGEGPGEWDAMSGAADLYFVENRFFTNNRDRFLFDLFDRSGNHIRSIPYSQYLNSSDKQPYSKGKLLVTTNGRDNALAVVMDLNEEGSVIQRIGSPESEYSEVRNFEQERLSYSNGVIPENDRNSALAVKGENGYFIFMNTLGELRHYSEEGELIFRHEIPEAIKTSVFDFIVQQNKEEVQERSVMHLEYARKMHMQNDLIYLFMAKPHPGALDIDFRMLVYDTDGELLHHYVLIDPDNESFLYDFALSSDNNIFFIDVMRSKVLRFMPNIE